MTTEGAAHRRVRLAMYGMMVLLALLSLIRAWRITESEAMRQLDMEIIRTASDEGVLTQRLGSQAAQLLLLGHRQSVEAAHLSGALTDSVAVSYTHLTLPTSDLV